MIVRLSVKGKFSPITVANNISQWVNKLNERNNINDTDNSKNMMTLKL